MAEPAKPAGQENTDTGAKPAAEAAKPAEGAKPDASKPAAADTGAKPAEGAKPEGGSKDGDGTPAPKAPDKYELSIPKGAEAFVDDADLSELAAVAKQNGWTNEQAQEFLEAQADTVAQRLGSLREVTEKDPTYGGDKLEEHQQHVKRIVDRVRPDGHPRKEAFQRLLVKTGIGNHIEMFSFLADIGKLMREDAPPGQSNTSGGAGKKPAEEVLYGGTTSK